MTGYEECDIMMILWNGYILCAS